MVSAAANREQARVVFDQAAKMVEASPALSAMAQVYRGRQRERQAFQKTLARAHRRVSALVTALARALVVQGSVYDTRPPLLVDL